MSGLTHPTGLAPQERIIRQALTEKAIHLVFRISATPLLSSARRKMPLINDLGGSLNKIERQKEEGKQYKMH